MAITFKQKKQMLDSLIASEEDLKERNCLTKIGEGHLSGLKSARQLVFGEIKKTKTKK